MPSDTLNSWGSARARELADCRIAGFRERNPLWPAGWPALNDRQRAMLGRLHDRVPGLFVATMDVYGNARLVVVLWTSDGRVRGREWALLRNGQLRGAVGGVPVRESAPRAAIAA
jgi:hypothetical protein